MPYKFSISAWGETKLQKRNKGLEKKKTLKAIDCAALCKPTRQKGGKESVCENDWFVFMFHHKLQKWNERHVVGVTFYAFVTTYMYQSASGMHFPNY